MTNAPNCAVGRKLEVARQAKPPAITNDVMIMPSPTSATAWSTDSCQDNPALSQPDSVDEEDACCQPSRRSPRRQ